MHKRKGIIIGLTALGLVLPAAAATLLLPWQPRHQAPADTSAVSADDAQGSGGSARAAQRARIQDAPYINARAKRKLLARLEGRLQPARPDRPDEAARFYLRKRVQADGTFPVARYALAAPRFRSRPNLAGLAPFSAPGATTAATLPAWQTIGPGNVGGRVRALVALPGTTNDILIAGGVSGGIWKSLDGGTSWTPKDDLMVNLAVSTLAIDPTDNQIIYAGTGEGYDVQPDITDGERSLKRGAGIFLSTDQGDTWTSMASTVAATGTPNERDFRFVNKIVVSPNSSSTLYAATNTNLWIGTLDGAGDATWTSLFPVTPPARGPAILDLAVVDNLGVDYAYLWVADRGLYVYAPAATPPVSVYALGTDTALSEYHRGVIAVDPNNLATAYVAVSNGSNFAIQGLYKTTNFFASNVPVLDLTSGTALARLNKIIFSNPLYAFARSDGTDCFGGFPADPGAYAQGWYDMAIAVDPIDSSRIWLGGIDLFRSDDGGQNFQMASTWWLDPSVRSYTHADQHVIVFAPGFDGSTNETMYFGNDGGIWKSVNAHSGTPLATDACHGYPGTLTTSSLPAIDYASLNKGLGVTQFWHGTVAAERDLVAGGTQDNGTIASNVPAGSGDPNAWSALAGGDGGYTFFDPSDSTTLYQEYYYIDIYRHSLNTDANGVVSSQLGDESTRISDGINVGSYGLFTNPYLLDPSYPSRLYVTNDHLWVTDNAKTAFPVVWRNLGILVPPFSSNFPVNGSALAIAPSDPRVLYVGMEDGRVIRAECTAPVLVAGNLPVGPGGAGRANRGLYGAAPASGGEGVRGGAWAVAAGLAGLLLLTGLSASGGLRRSRRGMPALPWLLALLLAAGSCVTSKSTSGGSGGSWSGGDNPPVPSGAFSTCNSYSLADRSPTTVAGFISSVTVHPADPNTVFATVSTFGEKHLWKSSDGGLNWVALDDSNGDGDVVDPGDIPDIPTHTLFIDPQHTEQLYLGTDLGVRFSADGGGTWTSVNSAGMANVVVETLAFRAASRTLYAFTHGRGVFALALP